MSITSTAKTIRSCSRSKNQHLVERPAINNEKKKRVCKH